MRKIFKIDEDGFIRAKHATKLDNMISILQNGLLIMDKSSDFGHEPEKKGIYFFIDSNETVIEGFKELGDDFCIIDFLIPASDIDKVVADEDSQEINFIRSLSEYGTACYQKEVKPEMIVSVSIYRL